GMRGAGMAGTTSEPTLRQPTTSGMRKPWGGERAVSPRRWAQAHPPINPHWLSSRHLSLSRLNHWLPRMQAHPEVVQGTTEFHHQIADALLPQADPVFHNAAALDTAVDMLDPQPPLMERLVGQVLLQSQLRTAGLLRRYEDLHLRERERQEAQILQHPTPGRERVGGGLSDAQIMGAAAVGVAQKEDREEGVDQQDIFDRMVLFLATITLRLF